MAAIFIVLVIIYLFVRVSESSKEFSKTEPLNQKMGLKTNARLEQSLVGEYLDKDSYKQEEIHPALDEAHKKSQEEVTRLGYVPCVPLDAYNKKYKWARPLRPETYTKDDLTYVRDIDDYDSYYVKSRRRRITDRYGDCPEMVLYEEYSPGELSVGKYFFNQEMKRCSISHKIRHKVGDYITCTYGLCKVLDIKYNLDSTKANYVLEVCKPNATFKQVEIPVTEETCSIDHRTLK